MNQLSYMYIVNYLVLLFPFFSVSFCSLPLPSYIKPCYIKDSSFKLCAQKHAMDALPFLINGDSKYHLPKLSPLHVVEMRIVPNNQFEIILTKVVINGLENGFVEIFDANWDQFKMHLKVRIPRFELLSDYVAKFEILSIPVRGSGPFNFTLMDAIFHVDVFMKSVYKNNVKYMEIKDDQLFLETSRAYFHFYNLSTSNPEISKNLNSIMNSNWQVVLEELRKPVSEVMMRVIETFFVGIMERVPQDQIFIP